MPSWKKKDDQWSRPRRSLTRKKGRGYLIDAEEDDSYLGIGGGGGGKKASRIATWTGGLA